MEDHNQHTAGNFSFLKEDDELLFQLAYAAESVFTSDPNTTLMKLRQLAEAMAQHIASVIGIEFDDQTSQSDLLYRLNREIQFEPVIRDLFHTLRIEGNRATHEFKTCHKEAMNGLKIARELAIWFHRSFGTPSASFKPEPFNPLPDPSAQLRELQSQIEDLKHRLVDSHQELEKNQHLNDLLDKEKSEFAALDELMDEESRKFAAQAGQHEVALKKQREEYEAKLKSLQAKLDSKDVQQTQSRKQTVKRSQKAGRQVELNEELTRIVIDLQLQETGWKADTQELTYHKGTRPEKGINRAIAEWPTSYKGKSGKADYVLFLGLMPIAVVEAKKENKNVAGKISQAERYSLGFSVVSPMQGAWESAGRTIAWPNETDAHYHIPFVYSCNGRPYVKQLAEQSGTWFRDVREQSNLKRALPGFHSPDGLFDLLKRSKAEAEEKLRSEGFSYLGLRDYQEEAIRQVELALAAGERKCLLAMATGTGKTRTVIGLIYRFLKAQRFKRVLFLVDRTSLGDQALGAFKDVTLEQNYTLWKSYNIAELGDMAGTTDRVQVATVQAMVHRVFIADSPPPVDHFDCIIVDEAHRGYTLDQEMTEGELATRDSNQYLSSFRRVLEYFDAVKIGLTATPAKHTSEIFGKPVYTYSYREAVADDWLIDHEPPIRYETLLSKNGIHFEKGSEVEFINRHTGEVESAELEDEVNFDIESFNRQVINEKFNQVICEELVKELDPFGDEKTLIFCAPARDNLHADMIKRLLDDSFKAMYGSEYKQAAVAKITGQSDKVDQLISEFKNERYPNIAITVDLLTTGIDVLKICNLVFLRRVKSRILYEQMIGRATRRCDEIGKTVFRIYDPVDIYAALENVNTMKPLAKDPKVTLTQLVEELTDPETLEQALLAPGEGQDSSHADVILSQISQKVMKVLRKAAKESEQKPELKQKLDELEQQWGVEPEKLAQHLRTLGPQQAAVFVKEQKLFINQLATVNSLTLNEHGPMISHHDDKLVVREQSYGKYTKPEDYLASFNQFIREQINLSAALGVVVNRPRDLTREQLKEIRLLLDSENYSEARLQSAWRNQTNQDIAASIIGYIRQAALGEPLIPFEQRVQRAMTKMYAKHNWLPAQRKWLDRLGKQLVHEVIVDRDFVNQRFADQGGAERFNKILDDQLDTVLDELGEALWEVA